MERKKERKRERKKERKETYKWKSVRGGPMLSPWWNHPKDSVFYHAYRKCTFLQDRNFLRWILMSSLISVQTWNSSFNQILRFRFPLLERMKKFFCKFYLNSFLTLMADYFQLFNWREIDNTYIKLKTSRVYFLWYFNITLRYLRIVRSSKIE